MFRTRIVCCLKVARIGLGGLVALSCMARGAHADPIRDPIAIGSGLPAGTTFDVGPASPLTIATTSGTVTVPITLSQFTPPSGAGNGAKGFQVTVRLSSGLKLVAPSIQPGP